MKLIVATALLLFSFLLLMEGQGWTQSTTRVGVLMLIKPDRPQLQGLRDGLQEAGYTDGQNFILDMPWLRTPEELRSRAKDYVKNGANVIVTTGNAETQMAKEITKKIPIVFMPASDPIAAGFVKSFPRPGANLTGAALIRDVDSYGIQLQVFKEAIPLLRKVVVLYDARNENPVAAKGLAQLKNVAAHFAIELDERPTREISEAEKVLDSLSGNSADGVFVLCSSLFGGGPEAIINLAIQKKLPLFSCGWTHQGALISLALDLYQIGRRGGWYVGQILRGAKPHDLPVEVPLRYELAINLKTANAIGVTIPVEVLQRADKVIR